VLQELNVLELEAFLASDDVPDLRRRCDDGWDVSDGSGGDGEVDEESGKVINSSGRCRAGVESRCLWFKANESFRIVHVSNFQRCHALFDKPLSVILERLWMKLNKGVEDAWSVGRITTRDVDVVTPDATTSADRKARVVGKDWCVKATFWFIKLTEHSLQCFRVRRRDKFDDTPVDLNASPRHCLLQEAAKTESLKGCRACEITNGSWVFHRFRDFILLQLAPHLPKPKSLVTVTINIKVLPSLEAEESLDVWVGMVLLSFFLHGHVEVKEGGIKSLKIRDELLIRTQEDGLRAEEGSIITGNFRTTNGGESPEGEPLVVVRIRINNAIMLNAGAE